ncbi:hypothetical protein YO5_11962 [Stutzerimonas stutzeri TS44]|nr:hypothetical protein YO5_11962 [Stutzerimonas stutzeri TS44]
MWKTICLLGTALAVNTAMMHLPAEHSSASRLADATQPGNALAPKIPAAHMLIMHGVDSISLNHPQRWVF